MGNYVIIFRLKNKSVLYKLTLYLSPHSVFLDMRNFHKTHVKRCTIILTYKRLLWFSDIVMSILFTCLQYCVLVVTLCRSTRALC